MMSEFVLMFWKDKPVDWLLEHMMYTRVCNPERDMHICQIEKRKIKVKWNFGTEINRSQEIYKTRTIPAHWNALVPLGQNSKTSRSIIWSEARCSLIS